MTPHHPQTTVLVGLTEPLLGLALWGHLASFLPAVGLMVPMLAAVIAGTRDVAILTMSSSSPSVETGAPTDPTVRGVWVR